MSQFKDLARHSKLFSLPPKGTKVYSDAVPRHQVLETSPASHHRRNWGLKQPVPSKAKSRFVAMGKLETEINIPDLNYNAIFYRRLKKFNETQAALTLHPHTELPSLFEAGPPRPRTFARMSPADRKNVIADAESRRLEYKQFVESSGSDVTAAAGPALFSRMLESQSSRPPSRRPGMIESFMDLPSGLFGGPNEPAMVSSAIGLSYQLKGGAINSPDGIYSAKPVYGRVLPRKSAKQAAVAGFAARMARGNRQSAIAEVPHQKPVPFRLDRATATSSAEVSLQVSQISEPRTDRRDLGDIVDSSVNALRRR